MHVNIMNFFEMRYLCSKPLNQVGMCNVCCNTLHSECQHGRCHHGSWGTISPLTKVGANACNKKYNFVQKLYCDQVAILCRHLLYF